MSNLKGFDYRVCPTIARGNWRFNLSNLHFAVQGNIDSTSSIVRTLRSGKKENWLTQYRPRLYYSQPTRRLPCAVHLYLNYPPSPCPTLPLSHPPLSIRGTGGGWQQCYHSYRERWVAVSSETQSLLPKSAKLHKWYCKAELMCLKRPQWLKG